MESEQTPLSAVPTHIITGFLGAGKTSAILHLLRSKPEHERWAILVNEFGEIGIDGSLFEGKYPPASDAPEAQGVVIREVPGGCMCCAAGLPMQIALNQLLSRARPHRLFIEPTGLGHPKEVLRTLSQAHYRPVLSLQKVLTLVDARKVTDPRYSEHATFNQQIAIGDIVVGNKLDLYNTRDILNLENYVKQHGAAHAKILFTQNAAVKLETLLGESQVKLPPLPQPPHGETQRTTTEPSSSATAASERPLPDCGYLKATNSGEGFNSVGWRFAADKVFSHAKLVNWINTIEAERAKGVFITDKGVFAYNLTADSTTEMELDDCLESRIEIIGLRPRAANEEGLLACLSQQPQASQGI